MAGRLAPAKDRTLSEQHATAPNGRRDQSVTTRWRQRPQDRAKDILGNVYEYFPRQFASAEGKNGGQFHTPSHVVRVLMEIIAPCKGRVADLCPVVLYSWLAGKPLPDAVEATATS
jgi:N-6 DNA Methylase